MDSIIKIKSLNKTFSKTEGVEVKAVKDVSFELYRGEVLGIVGESGSGKSTLAKLITGLIPATDGEIIVNQMDIGKLKGKEKRSIYKDIQMVFQNPVQSFNPRKTLGYGIGESLRNQGMERTQIVQKQKEFLEMCGLDEEFAKRYPHEVSGGQCQRAAIARALVNEPKILICDEATSALDVTVQKQIIELIQDLRKKRELSIIFICHNMALVQMLCDRIIVMHDGQIVEEGIPDKIINNPQDDYTKMLIDSIFRLGR